VFEKANTTADRVGSVKYVISSFFSTSPTQAQTNEHIRIWTSCIIFSPRLIPSPSGSGERPRLFNISGGPICQTPSSLFHLPYSYGLSAWAWTKYLVEGREGEVIYSVPLPNSDGPQPISSFRFLSLTQNAESLTISILNGSFVRHQSRRKLHPW